MLVPSIFDSMYMPFGNMKKFPSFDKLFFTVLGMRSDVKDFKDRYEIDIDMPGMKKDDIEISFADGVLTVSAKNEKSSKPEEDGTSDTEEGFEYVTRERVYTATERSFTFEDGDESNIKAEFHKGVLHIVMGKKTPEEPEKKLIAIE